MDTLTNNPPQNSLDQKLKSLAPKVLRVGLALVFLWFGTQQIFHASQWVGWIPAYILNILPVGAVAIVYFNGAFEVVFGTALLFGIFMRVTALLLALHMAHITFTVGYSEIGVRDFGLAVATFSLFLFGRQN